MTAVNKTNRFFVDNIYRNLSKFATCPFTGWNLDHAKGGIDAGFALKIMFFPMLAQLTIITASIAFSLALMAGFIHLLTLSVAATADVCNSTPGLT